MVIYSWSCGRRSRLWLCSNCWLENAKHFSPIHMVSIHKHRFYTFEVKNLVRRLPMFFCVHQYRMYTQTTSISAFIDIPSFVYGGYFLFLTLYHVSFCMIRLDNP